MDIIRHKVRVKTPFYAANKYVKINPRNCIMIEKKAFNKLVQFGDETEILFHITFDEYGINEQRITTCADIKNLLEIGKAKERFNERLNDMVINIDKNDCRIL